MRIERSDNHYYLKQAINNEGQFARRVRELVRDLWVGDIDEHEFYAQMSLLILHGYEIAWEEGQESVGATTFYPFYSSAVKEIAARDMSFLYGFAGYIIENNRGSGGKLSSLQSRTGLWINGFNKIKNYAKWQIGEDILLIWERHSKDGCGSCIALDQKVYTATEWRDFNIRPQHPSLACMIDAGGIPVCRCTLLPTDRPKTRGSFPAAAIGIHKSINIDFSEVLQ